MLEAPSAGKQAVQFGPGPDADYNAVAGPVDSSAVEDVESSI